MAGVLGGQLLVGASQQAVGGCQLEVPDQKLSWPESHHHLFFRTPLHQSPGNNTWHPQLQGELKKKFPCNCRIGILNWGGAFRTTCLPSTAPQQRGKVHRSSKLSAIDLHSSVEGTAMNSSTRQSQIAVTTSGMILQTVETPTRKLLAMVLKESPVARYLQHKKYLL